MVAEELVETVRVRVAGRGRGGRETAKTGGRRPGDRSMVGRDRGAIWNPARMVQQVATESVVLRRGGRLLETREVEARGGRLHQRPHRRARRPIRDPTRVPSQVLLKTEQVGRSPSFIEAQKQRRGTPWGGRRGVRAIAGWHKGGGVPGDENSSPQSRGGGGREGPRERERAARRRRLLPILQGRGAGPGCG